MDATLQEAPVALEPHALGVALGGVGTAPWARDQFMNRWMRAEIERSTSSLDTLFEFGRALEGRASQAGALDCDGAFMRAFFDGVSRFADLPSGQAAASQVWHHMAMVSVYLAGGEAMDARELSGLVTLALRACQRSGSAPGFDLAQEAIAGMATALGGEGLFPRHLTVLFEQAVAVADADRLPGRFTALFDAVGADNMLSRSRAALLAAVAGADGMPSHLRRSMIWRLTPLRDHFQYGVRHLLHHAGDLSVTQIGRLMQALCDEGRHRLDSAGGHGRSDGSRRIRLSAIAEEISGVAQAGTRREVPRSHVMIPHPAQFPSRVIMALAAGYAVARGQAWDLPGSEDLLREFKPAIDALPTQGLRDQQKIASGGALLAREPFWLTSKRELPLEQRRDLLALACQMPGLLDGRVVQRMLEDIFKSDSFDRASDRWILCRTLFQHAAPHLSLAHFSRTRKWLCDGLGALPLTGRLLDAALDCLVQVYAVSPQAADWDREVLTDYRTRGTGFIEGERQALHGLFGRRAAVRQRIEPLLLELENQARPGTVADRKSRPGP